MYDQSETATAAGMARIDFYFYVRWMFLQRKGYKWLRGPHHPLVCAALERVFRCETNRLIINIPPRYSKTQLVTDWITWCLGHVPDSEFILTSYSSDLATNNSWAARDTVMHPAYQQIFPDVRIRSDSKAKDDWRTTAGGVVYAAGAKGTVTGYGAGKQREGFGGAIVIDDPHKPDEAKSDTIRGGVIDWFQNTLESRKNDPKNTPIILIMQRLHESDLSGWLLEGKNGEDWEHISLPALCESEDDPLGREIGEALWPAKHTAEMLGTMSDAAPYTYAGQYQQRPSPLAGGIFKPHMLEIVDAIPHGTRFVRGWDLAATEEQQGKDPDWTVGGKLGVMPDGRYIIADIERFRDAPEVVRDTIKKTANADGQSTRIKLPQDPGQAGKAQGKSFVAMLSGYSVVCEPVTGDKVTRAEPFAAQVNVGNVVMLRATWNDAVKEEMRSFPNGKHDDIIDSVSDAFNTMASNTYGLLDVMEALAKEKAEQQAKVEADADANAQVLALMQTGK